MNAPVVEITYHGVRRRLGQIELDLANRQSVGETAASTYYRAKRDFEHKWAQEYLRTEGTVEERKQRTILKLWDSKEYRDLVKAEADFEGWKAVYRTLETRGNIGMALLKSMTREAREDLAPTQPEPQFSGAR